MAKRRNKTQGNLRLVRAANSNYGKLSKASGIEGKRLSAIASGKQKATRSEISKISSFAGKIKKNGPFTDHVIAQMLSGYNLSASQIGRGRNRGKYLSKKNEKALYIAEIHRDGCKLMGKDRRGDIFEMYILYDNWKDKYSVNWSHPSIAEDVQKRTENGWISTDPKEMTEANKGRYQTILDVLCEEGRF